MLLYCCRRLLSKAGSINWKKIFFYYQFEKFYFDILQQVGILQIIQRTRISLNSSSQLIDFYTNHTELSWRILPVPKSIKLGSRYSIYFKAGSGNVSTDQPGNGNIPKVVFTDEGKVITYQFQMGTGNMLIYQSFNHFLPQIYHNLQIINQFPHQIRRFFFFFFQYVTVNI